MSATATVAACTRRLRLAATALRCFASVEVSEHAPAVAHGPADRARRESADEFGRTTSGTR